VPLSFQSMNHGSIAFGFFNIESDMLLLQQYFFFADAFCRYVSGCAEHEIWNPVEKFTVFEIDDPVDVGDLMGAINGIRYSGFIGDSYRRFPFPENPALYKQNPLGCETQKIFREMIAPYAKTTEIPFSRLQNRCIRIGDYIFTQNNFSKLLRYVEEGGFPRWQDNLKPDYVDRMKQQISESKNEIFSG